MPLNEFWYGDIRLLKVYQIAYYRDVSYKCWLQGQYDLAAFSVVMANAFSKNGSKQAEYPKWKDPMEKYVKPKKVILDNNAEHTNQIKWFAEMMDG